MRLLKNPPPAAKVLSEAEIQTKLYGAARGRRAEETVGSSPAGMEETWTKALQKGSNQAWTGEEILVGELKRLRDDLIHLKKERDLLAARLERHGERSVSPSAELRREEGHSAARLWGIVLGLAVLSGVVATPIGWRFLDASPVSGEPAPYTIQCGVYYAKEVGQQAVVRLRTMGFQAYLVEFPRKSGGFRYRIYIGSFVTKAEAHHLLAQLTADPRYADAFVRLK